MTRLDLLVFFSVLIITFLAVLYGYHRRQKGSDSLLDYLLMGRQLTLPLFVATLVATWYGGIFGVTQIAFERGIFNFITQGIFWYVTYIIFALFLVEKVHAYQAVTLPEMTGKMFGPKSARLSAIFNFFNVVPITYAVSIGLFIQIIFGIEFFWGVFWGVTFVVGYSLLGGFRADVFSDLVQFFVMCTAVVLVAVISVKNYGGYSFLKANLPATHFSPGGGAGWEATLVWGFIALATLVNPAFYQRCFAAKSPEIARKGIFLSTLIWFGFDICTTLGGMYARAVMPAASSKTAYLDYALQILPDGFRGFVLAGIVATILSTLDSYLFIAGTTLTYDLSPQSFRGKKSFHNLGIVGIGLLAIILANLFEGDIRDIWKTLGSYFAACLLFPVICGFIFPGKIRDNQFVFACLLGVLATTYWRLVEHSGFWAHVDDLYAGLVATAVGLALYKDLRKMFKLGVTLFER